MLSTTDLRGTALSVTELRAALPRAESDVEAAAATLAKAGFDIRRPPEDWLFKAALDVDGPAVVDVLHQINRVPVDAAMIADAATNSTAVDTAITHCGPKRAARRDATCTPSTTWQWMQV